MPGFVIWILPLASTLIPMVLSPDTDQPGPTDWRPPPYLYLFDFLSRSRYAGDTAEMRPVRTQVRSTWRVYSSRPSWAWRPGQFLYPSSAIASRIWTRELRPKPRRS